MKKQLKCYIYTRVSTSMQVDGYSLDAQKDKLHKYADYQDMIIAGNTLTKVNPVKAWRVAHNFNRCFRILKQVKTTLILYSYSSYPDLDEMQRMFYHLFSECRILVLILSV